ncbi:MAG: AAA family ATPase [Theionarchaea archaeon]|nr:AAA family ATPase [Theionarchaea archaeon]
MDIKKVRVRSFRSIIDSGEVTFDEKLLIMIGRNEQGKTNFLRALESFGVEYSYRDDDLCYLVSDFRNHSVLPILTIWFELDENDKRILKETSPYLEKCDELMITKLSNNKYEAGGPGLEAFLLQMIGDADNILKTVSDRVQKAKLGLDATDEKKQIDWLLSLQKYDGGFSHNPGEPSGMACTFFAVMALKELGALDQVDRNNLVRFIVSTKHPGGGFGSAPQDPPKVQHTYQAICLLRVLRASNRIGKKKQIDWLLSLQKLEGGFSHNPREPSGMACTYFAVMALKELGALDQVDSPGLIEFILSVEHPGGGFGSAPQDPPKIQHTYQAICLLRALRASNRISKKKQIDWLLSLQRADGGFSHNPGEYSEIMNTFFAVIALRKLGALDQVDSPGLIEFILSAEHPGGGFGSAPQDPPKVQHTYQAIQSLECIRDHIRLALERARKGLTDSEGVREVEVSIDLIINILERFLNEEMQEATEELKKVKSYRDSVLLPKILRLVPNFIYFDSIDLLDDKVSIEDYSEGKFKTFSSLFQLAGLDIEKIRNTQDVHQRKRMLRTASATISGLVNESWGQENVDVQIDVDGDLILVCVEDEEGAKADPPSKRSDGFRWFLSFYINFMAGTRKELQNAVLLLDNPGWVLHPSGQKDLLDVLERISEDNQIVITTHSPFLINKNKLERIRIVERKKDVGTKVYEKFWDSMFDCFQVIRAAIGAEISDSLFGHKNNIVVEGYCDKVYLETLANYLKNRKRKTIDLDKLMIIGAGGADKIPSLMAWHKAEKYNTIGVLDSDRKAHNVISAIERKFQNVDVNNDILKLNEIDESLEGTQLEIEDLFGEEFFLEAVNDAYQDIFRSKLDCSKIEIGEFPKHGLTIERYSRLFKDRNLGGFDKLKVAQKIKELLTEEKIHEELMQDTMDNFEKLFVKIIEKFEGKQAEVGISP